MTENREALPRHSACPGKWQSEQGNDKWTVEIEVDRFSTDEPYVVSLFIENVDTGVADYDPERTSNSLATLTPAQAREIAVCLIDTAASAEHAEMAVEVVLLRGAVEKLKGGGPDA